MMMMARQTPGGPTTPDVMAVLEDWFQAIQNGTAAYRYPGANASSYSDEDVDRIIAAIDEEIDGEVTRNTPHWNAKGIYQGSGFSRLLPLQRRALVEELQTAIEKARELAAQPTPSI